MVIQTWLFTQQAVIRGAQFQDESPSSAWLIWLCSGLAREPLFTFNLLYLHRLQRCCLANKAKVKFGSALGPGQSIYPTT